MCFRQYLCGAALFGVFLLNSTSAKACDTCQESEHKHAHAHIGSTANDHAPIGVMGDHMHKQGEWMLSYRFMRMSMNGNRSGTRDISPEQIVTTVPNRFFGTPGQPATLRVVPTEMTMDMHMLGAMYAPSDWLTLTIMANYLDKDMDHITFAGGAGTTRLGTFTTESKGWGDTKLGGLVRLYHDDMHHVHLNAALSIPTGSIKETDDVLTPMNMRSTLRLPYGMQLGTGTYDLLPGVTYAGRKNAWEWGAQYSAQIPLESENDQGYQWDDKHSLTAWGSYEWAPWISTSLRLTGATQGQIDGIDPNIVAPVQTANPNNYGGETLEAGIGVNLIATHGPLKDSRIAFEISKPLYQDLNGPQMKRDYTATIGLQFAF